MTNVHLSKSTQEVVLNEGPLMHVAVLRVPASTVSKLAFEEHEDDLDSFSAYFFRIGEVGASLQRYHGSPRGLYTLMIDVKRLRNLQLPTGKLVSGLISQWLKLTSIDVQWVVEDIRREVLAELRERDIELKMRTMQSALAAAKKASGSSQAMEALSNQFRAR